MVKIPFMINRTIYISSNNRYFIDGGGNPVLIVSDAGWGLVVELSPSEIDTYLEDRTYRGFNAVIIRLIDHLFGTNAPNNYNNDAPFTTPGDFTTPNENYFSHVDYALDKMVELGMYALIAPLYLGFSGTEEGWDTEVNDSSVADIQDWGEYVGNRYKNYRNIIWVMVGDRNPTTPIDFTAKNDAFVTGLQTYDAHLISAHCGRGAMAVDFANDQSWLDFNTTYSTYLATSSENKDGYDYSPTMPFLHIEGYYENEHSMTAQGLRAQGYWSILGGAVGHIFGNNPIWKFAYDGGDWEAALDDPGSVGMTHLSAFFNSIDWHTLVPDYDHSLVTVGYGTIGTADYAGAGIDSGGTLAAIYMPSNRTMTVDMSQFADTVTARWFDPTNGSYTADAASPLSNSGTNDFSRATANNDGDADWVLLLET